MIRVGFALLFGWLVTMPLIAQTPQEAAAQLAARISSLLLRPAIVSLEVDTRAQIDPVESSSFRATFVSELKKVSVEIAEKASPDQHLRLTISANERGRLAVVQVIQGETRQIAMTPWERPQKVDSKPALALERTAILSWNEPILDLLLFDSGSEALVLGESKVASYRLFDRKWTLAATTAINATRPLPRDPRGRILAEGGALKIYLPGTTCTGAVQPAMSLACSSSNDAWAASSRPDAPLVRWTGDRNWMEATSGNKSFYSTAAGLTASLDGQFLDASAQPVAGTAGWGSDLVAIEPSCESAPLIVTSAAGSDAGVDLVQANRIVDGRATPVSSPLPLSGRVTALWPADRGSAILVIHNAETGEYEASRLALACAR